MEDQHPPTTAPPPPQPAPIPVQPLCYFVLRPDEEPARPPNYLSNTRGAFVIGCCCSVGQLACHIMATVGVRNSLILPTLLLVSFLLNLYGLLLAIRAIIAREQRRGMLILATVLNLPLIAWISITIVGRVILRAF